MLKAAESGKISAVFVFGIKHISQNYDLAFELVDRLNELGVVVYDNEGYHELLCCLQSRHIVPRDRRDGRKPDSSDLPQAEICGLQQAVLEKADVQGVCAGEMRL